MLTTRSVVVFAIGLLVWTQSAHSTDNNVNPTTTLAAIEEKLNQLTELTSKQSAEIETLKAENGVLLQTANRHQTVADQLVKDFNTAVANGTDGGIQFSTSGMGIECYTESNGGDYRGLVSTTINGLTCQKWTEQSPHQHTSSPLNYPNAGLGDHNYCRNPDGTSAPWCYTTDSDTRWEFCNVGQPSNTCSQNHISNMNSGVVYTRWGHTTCPGNGDEHVYTGVMGGDFYNTKGGAARYICLPRTPVYDGEVSGVGSSRGYVYPVEYEINDGPLADSYDHDVPCTVCRVPDRSVMIMVPGRNDCPSHAWTREYYGYLVANRQHSSFRSTEYICIDRNPQHIPGTSANTNGGVLFYVEGRCLTGGGLPCGPYVDGHELTCAVCTR